MKTITPSFLRKLAASKWIYIWGVLPLLFCCLSCHSSNARDDSSLLNLSHLDHLYQEVVIDGKKMGIVHIYADAPDYQWAEAAGEGIACVDDAARAAIFYLRHYQDTGQTTSLEKARNLLDFLLHMQAPNGLFYNFVYQDLSTNTIRENSAAKADWWGWRVVWALSEGSAILLDSQPEYARQLYKQATEVLPAIDSILQNYPNYEVHQGLRQPAWLPHGTASDQTSELLLGLIRLHKTAPISDLLQPINLLSEGMLGMQAGDSATFPYGCILAWQNTWHAWGSSQPEVLFQAGELLHKLSFTRAAYRVVDYFYPYLIRQNYLNSLNIALKNGTFIETIRRQYPQIAYDIRPLVMASLEAYRLSGKGKYAQQAADIACWLLGKNIAGQPLYDPTTGRCFDGIENIENLNRNSGAESTIEALLTLQAIEKYPAAQKIVKKYYREHLETAP